MSLSPQAEFPESLMDNLHLHIIFSVLDSVVTYQALAVRDSTGGTETGGHIQNRQTFSYSVTQWSSTLGETPACVMEGQQAARIWASH